MLDSRPKDRQFYDCIRLAVAPDAQGAPTWQVVERDGKKFLQVKEVSGHREHAWVDRWYLAVPPNSIECGTSMNLNSLGVTPDIQKAMPVDIVPRDCPNP